MMPPPLQSTPVRAPSTTAHATALTAATVCGEEACHAGLSVQAAQPADLT